MTIKTKFNRTDEVHLMWNNRCITAIIDSIQCYVGVSGVSVDYYLEGNAFGGANSYERKFPEERLFRSKDELLKSI